MGSNMRRRMSRMSRKSRMSKVRKSWRRSQRRSNSETGRGRGRARRTIRQRDAVHNVSGQHPLQCVSSDSAPGSISFLFRWDWRRCAILQ